MFKTNRKKHKLYSAKTLSKTKIEILRQGFHYLHLNQQRFASYPHVIKVYISVAKNGGYKTVHSDSYIYCLGVALYLS